MIENEFDIKVRSLLEDAVEEVPAGVWEGVSGALDKAAAKPRRVAPVFWWRMTTCLAAAAAVVAVVLLWPVKKYSAPEETA